MTEYLALIEVVFLMLCFIHGMDYSLIIEEFTKKILTVWKQSFSENNVSVIKILYPLVSMLTENVDNKSVIHSHIRRYFELFH